MRRQTLLLVLLIVGSSACADRSREVAVVDTDEGSFVIGFFDDVAPRHVGKFKVLSRSGLYDGTCFEKIVPGEFILSGDPYAVSGLSSSAVGEGVGTPFDEEVGRMKHHRGTVSMARAEGSRYSGGQFFICRTDLPHLDGLFVVIGEVVEGMPVVDRIGSVPVDSTGRPVRPICIRSIAIETRPVH